MPAGPGAPSQSGTIVEVGGGGGGAGGGGSPGATGGNGNNGGSNFGLGLFDLVGAAAGFPFGEVGGRYTGDY